MAQQLIEIGENNQGEGDTLPVCFTKTNENFTDLNAENGIINSRLDALEGLSRVSIYWFDDNDASTSVTPIVHTANSSATWLTNDSLGLFTNSYNPLGNDKVWDESTNLYDFSSLKIGDTISVRIDVEVTTSAVNQELDFKMSLAEGTGSGYELNLQHYYYKSASTNPVTFVAKIYIGDEATRTGGARFRFVSANNATIKVNGWYTRITSV